LLIRRIADYPSCIQGIRFEPEIERFSQDAAWPAGTIRLGSALAAIGDKYGGIELEPASRDETMRTAELP